MKGVPPIAFNIRASEHGLSEEKLTNFLQGYHAATTFMDAQVGRCSTPSTGLGWRTTRSSYFAAITAGYSASTANGRNSACSKSRPASRWSSTSRRQGKWRGVPWTVELMDLYPTLTEACGVEAPQTLQGKSLALLLDNPAAAWDRPAYTQVTRNVGSGQRRREVMGRSVRTERWRYTAWDDGKQGVELYDHDADPHEWKNLTTDPSNAATVQEMKRLLAAIRH